MLLNERYRKQSQNFRRIVTNQVFTEKSRGGDAGALSPAAGAAPPPRTPATPLPSATASIPHPGGVRDHTITTKERRTGLTDALEMLSGWYNCGGTPFLVVPADVRVPRSSVFIPLFHQGRILPYQLNIVKFCFRKKHSEIVSRLRRDFTLEKTTVKFLTFSPR